MGNRDAALLLFLVLLISGCASNTGDIINTTTATKGALGSQIAGENQTPEDTDELRKEFQEFEKSQASIQPKKNAAAGNASQQKANASNPGGGGASVQETERTVRTCPSSCDDNDSCTGDSCSSGTGYECIHRDIIPCCGNSKCEQGENFTACMRDCPCTLECGTCETLDSQRCSCLPKGCASGDGCCPGSCNHTTDNDCPNPDSCQSDSDCSDSDSCTKDICSGKPKECFFPPLTECVPGDGCCPGNCSYPQDSDCSRPSVVFSEIYYDAPGNDKNHEWIEVYNNGTMNANLSGWRFQEGATQHKIAGIGSEIIGKGSFAVIAQNATQFMYDYPGYNATLFDSSFDLSNSNETLILRAGKDDAITDQVSYSSEWGGGNGFSLERTDLNGPNSRENWNQSVAERGTPGERNSISLLTAIY